MARQMVVNYGFSDIGPWSLLDPSAQSQDMIMRMMAKNSTSESLQMKIDEAVKKIADEAYEVALRHIRYIRSDACDIITSHVLCTQASFFPVCAMSQCNFTMHMFGMMGFCYIWLHVSCVSAIISCC